MSSKKQPSTKKSVLEKKNVKAAPAKKSASAPKASAAKKAAPAKKPAAKPIAKAGKPASTPATKAAPAKTAAKPAVKKSASAAKSASKAGSKVVAKATSKTSSASKVPAKATAKSGTKETKPAVKVTPTKNKTKNGNASTPKKGSSGKANVNPSKPPKQTAQTSVNPEPKPPVKPAPEPPVENVIEDSQESDKRELDSKSSGKKTETTSHAAKNDAILLRGNVKLMKTPFFSEEVDQEDRTSKKKSSPDAVEKPTTSIRHRASLAEETSEELYARVIAELQEENDRFLKECSHQLCSKCCKNPVSPDFRVDKDLGYCEECAEILGLGRSKEARHLNYQANRLGMDSLDEARDDDDFGEAPSQEEIDEADKDLDLDDSDM